MNKGNGSRMFSTKVQEKPKDVKYVLRRLWDYTLKFKYWLLFALVLNILASLFALVGPKLSGHIVDDISMLIVGDANTETFKDIFFYIILMIVFYVCSSLFSYILSIVMMRMSKKIVYKLRKDVFDKLQDLPISYFDSHQVGDIISRMSYDIDTINTCLSSDVIQIITSAITIVGSLVMMITISPLLILVFVVTIPISLLFTRFVMKKTQPLFRKRSRSLGDLGGYTEEIITGIKSVKSYCIEDEVLVEYDKYNDAASDAAYKAEYYGCYNGPGVNFVNNLSMSLICIFGSLMLLKDPKFIGNFSSFVMYSRKFSGPINEIANIIVDIQSALAAGERVFTMIDEAPEAKDKETDIALNEVDGNISAKSVSFSYNETREILHDISFDALKGKTVAIVGPTGSGKTTIVNLLMRFYEVSKGSITLDGVDVRDIKRSDLRRSFSMVLQDTWLFQGTVFENVAYGKHDATMEDVVNACKAAKVDGFISRLKDGYNTVLNEGGINISKGQKQLLTIARSMLVDTNMLILDEATSNVDTKTEVEIQRAMKTLMKGKTSFVIAHRLSTIKNADIILVIKDGCLVEAGTHTELLTKKGFYSELYYSQFK